jgi:LysR family glycine cleavage system transcriptional activator
MLGTVPISSIRVFESAARTGSFRGAANELHLSPSAVSHAIRKLETALGTTLFERGVRRVHLTPAGESLMRHACTAFDELRQGLQSVARRGPHLLRVHSAPSFASQWLAPRLSRFLTENPGIDVRLAANTDYARFINDDFDVDIVYGKPRAESVVTIPLGEEVVTPLCAPALASRISTPADLAAHTLITSDNKLVRWNDWFAANKIASPATHGMRFDRSFLAIAMAADGLGVALESTRLAEREISQGKLVAPLAGKSLDIRYVGHTIAMPATHVRRGLLRAFANWILGELDLPTMTIENNGTVVSTVYPATR